MIAQQQMEAQERIAQQQMEAQERMGQTLFQQRAVDNLNKFRVNQESEDIQDYHILYERHMVTNGVDEDEWVQQLGPLLTGRAGMTYAKMDPDAPYHVLKLAILRRYEINSKSSKMKLHQMRLRPEDDVAALVWMLVDQSMWKS